MMNGNDLYLLARQVKNLEKRVGRYEVTCNAAESSTELMSRQLGKHFQLSASVQTQSFIKNIRKHTKRGQIICVSMEGLDSMDGAFVFAIECIRQCVTRIVHNSPARLVSLLSNELVILDSQTPADSVMLAFRLQSCFRVLNTEIMTSLGRTITYGIAIVTPGPTVGVLPKPSIDDIWVFDQHPGGVLFNEPLYIALSLATRARLLLHETYEVEAQIGYDDDDDDDNDDDDGVNGNDGDDGNTGDGGGKADKSESIEAKEDRIRESHGSIMVGSFTHPLLWGSSRIIKGANFERVASTAAYNVWPMLEDWQDDPFYEEDEEDATKKKLRRVWVVQEAALGDTDQSSTAWWERMLGQSLYAPGLAQALLNRKYHLNPVFDAVRSPAIYKLVRCYAEKKNAAYLVHLNRRCVRRYAVLSISIRAQAGFMSETVDIGGVMHVLQLRAKLRALALEECRMLDGQIIGPVDGSCTGSSAAEGVSLTFLLSDLFTAVLAATSFLEKMRQNSAIIRDLAVIERSVPPQFAGVVCAISEGLVADFEHADVLGPPIHQALAICRALEWEQGACYPILPADPSPDEPPTSRLHVHRHPSTASPDVEEAASSRRHRKHRHLSTRGRAGARQSSGTDTTKRRFTKTGKRISESGVGLQCDFRSGDMVLIYDNDSPKITHLVSTPRLTFYAVRVLALGYPIRCLLVDLAKISQRLRSGKAIFSRFQDLFSM